MGEEDLHNLINGCIEQDRKCQKQLYKAFYGFAMGICLRYAGDRDTAAEVMNQGFLKVFTNIGRYEISKPFKGWLGRIMINVSIDQYRANLKMGYNRDIDEAENVTDGQLTDRNLHYNDLLTMVQRLPQAYRTVFNLFAIEGYSHEEIGEMLNIHAGTSKSNLHKARQKLKQMILNADATANNTNYHGINYTPMVAIKAITMNGMYSNNDILR